MEWKTLLVLSLVMVLVIIPSLTLAQEGEETELEDPGILPDHPFYGFKLFTERLRLMFAFSEKAKIQLKLKIAERRLAEAEQMVLMNKTQIMQRVMERYQEQLQEMEQIRERLRLRNITADDVDEWMNRTTNKHIYVLRRVLQQAPPAAVSGLQNALQNAETNREKIRERLMERIEEERPCPQGPTCLKNPETDQYKIFSGCNYEDAIATGWEETGLEPRNCRRPTTVTQQTTTTTAPTTTTTQANVTVETNETAETNETQANSTQGQQKGSTLTTLVPI